MPHENILVAGITARQGRIDLPHLFPVNRRGQAVIVPLPVMHAFKSLIAAKHLRIPLCQPCRARRGGGGQNNPNPVFRQPLDDFIHPFKVIPPLLGFKPCPGKNPQRDRIDPGQFHQADILKEHLRIVQPLVRIVIAAVKKHIGIIHSCLPPFFYIPTPALWRRPFIVTRCQSFSTAAFPVLRPDTATLRVGPVTPRHRIFRHRCISDAQA